ncbi:MULTISPECIES: ATP-dependent RNA helicase SrmB [Gammaproteobacteria]|uniref:ATP-dependent RNA helicase SrmB n=1 Tax=Gammaproteobacteria TaxID=1236 RepID=UPI001E4E1E75|nr:MULTISPECIES: ATP-dependent RNA helicase SrmB [Gammaproteobacteria]MDP4946278.1 ATP-dependent RNA helicase SrmB [Alishewanella sp.]MCC5452608.1 ATP-dependent RNA helicase SrmB [Rheinheimera sp. UJ51]MCF4010172.1 ATP-dependent RNA helicase SrmB [Rheinheimera sp. UJ63]MDP5034534.1 ATP-dependent RNA helicase SrmB [Alishewanella sp.]MDP5185766.1 ATP-dependent RNA helicase SrmB [Alishewanella sp.]
MSFAEFQLDDALNRALETAGFSEPTQIQQLALPLALEGRDIMASAPTGTGKTLAFVLPAIQYLLDFSRRDPGFARVLVMTPTRELAYQVYDEFRQFSQHTTLNIGLITGGVNYGSHKDTLEKNNDILVATPGRLIEYLDEESFQADEVEVLILDEADRMLDMGFVGEMNRIVLEARRRRQTMLFSATLEGATLERFASHSLKEPERIEAHPSRKEKAKILQWCHLADDINHKLAMLIHILQQEDVTKAIVFVKTRERLATLSGQLETAGLRCCWLQGEMPQDKRLQALARFTNNQVRILVATDVAARGLDIDDISHVINFDMPRSADVYVHRIGRTGRAGKKGTAISLVEAHDMSIVAKVERYTEQKLKRRNIEGLRAKNKEAKVASKKKKPGKLAAKKLAKKAPKK